MKSSDTMKSDVPCKGYTIDSINFGRDFDCGYSPEFGCEECVVNGGDRDPRQEEADNADLHNAQCGKGPYLEALTALARHLGYRLSAAELPYLEAYSSDGTWVLEGIVLSHAAEEGKQASHELPSIDDTDIENPVAALRLILALDEFKDVPTLQAAARKIDDVRTKLARGS